MSEASAAPSSAPATNGAASPSQTPSPTPQTNGQPSPVKPTGTRSNNGQFLPKDGTVGLVAQETTEEKKAAAEVKEEARRLKLKLKSKRGEEAWEGTEADAQREIQQGRDYARKVQELTRQLAERDAQEASLKERPDEFLKARGIDPVEFGKSQVMKLLELEGLNDDQRARMAAEQERDELKTWKEQQEKSQLDLKREMLQKQLNKKRFDGYKGAMKELGVAPSHAFIMRMAQAEATIRDEEGRHDFTHAELAREAMRAAESDAEAYLNAMPIEALAKRLGKQRFAALMQHSIDIHEQASGQGLVAVGHHVEEPAPPVDSSRPTLSDEEELNRRIKEMRNRLAR